VGGVSIRRFAVLTNPSVAAGRVGPAVHAHGRAGHGPRAAAAPDGPHPRPAREVSGRHRRPLRRLRRGARGWPLALRRQRRAAAALCVTTRRGSVLSGTMLGAHGRVSAPSYGVTRSSEEGASQSLRKGCSSSRQHHWRRDDGSSAGLARVGRSQQNAKMLSLSGPCQHHSRRRGKPRAHQQCSSAPRVLVT